MGSGFIQQHSIRFHGGYRCIDAQYVRTEDEGGGVAAGRVVVTVNTAAKLLGVAPNSYRAAARRGEVPAIYIGRRLVVPRSALEKMLGERLGEGNGTDGRPRRPIDREE